MEVRQGQIVALELRLMLDRVRYEGDTPLHKF